MTTSPRARFALPRIPFAPLAFCALFGLAATAVLAQPAPAAGYEPKRGQPGKDVMWIATPDSAVDRMLQMAEVRATDRLVDLGSGDGKIAITAARNHGATASGLEFNPRLVELSTSRARDAGVADKVDFRRADIFTTDFSSANVVTMYLLPELNLRLRPILFRMAPGTRVVSHSWTMGDWQPDETAAIGTANLYLWRVPANVSGTWDVVGGGPPDAPQRLRFSQRFQKVEGDAAFGPVVAGAVLPVLSGDMLSFGLRDGGGALSKVTARITGDRMRGTLARGGEAGRPFEAVRAGEAAPIAGVGATPEEMNSAARVLD